MIDDIASKHRPEDRLEIVRQFRLALAKSPHFIVLSTDDPALTQALSLGASSIQAVWTSGGSGSAIEPGTLYSAPGLSPTRQYFE